MDDAFQAVEAGDEEVLEVKAFQIFDGRGFPEVEAAGILRGGNESQLDARAEAEDPVAGDFEIPIAYFFVKQLVFLTTSNDFCRKAGRIQQETQTVCPLKDTGFLPGKRRRPRCFSISR